MLVHTIFNASFILFILFRSVLRIFIHQLEMNKNDSREEEKKNVVTVWFYIQTKSFCFRIPSVSANQTLKRKLNLSPGVLHGICEKKRNPLIKIQTSKRDWGLLRSYGQKIFNDLYLALGKFILISLSFLNSKVLQFLIIISLSI